ncbi:MAG: hypothetical protein SLRJCFUN_001018, partial [Candidatus Fervidibacter sp.]
MVVADSHSNKVEQPDAPSNFLLERLLAATKAMRMMAMFAAKNGSYSRRDFPNLLVTGAVSCCADKIGQHGVQPCPT